MTYYLIAGLREDYSGFVMLVHSTFMPDERTVKMFEPTMKDFGLVTPLDPMELMEAAIAMEKQRREKVSQ